MLRSLLLSLLVIAIAAAAIVGWSYWSFSRSINAEVATLVAAATDNPGVITEADLLALPTPVQRYLRSAGVLGRAIPSVVRLSQTGRLRGSADAAWMTFEAEQVYSTNPPALVWRAWFPSRAIPLVMGRDAYLDGAGGIEMKMLGVFPVASQSGGPLIEAVLMRYLNEIMWFPQAYVGDNVTWRALDAHSAQVSIADRGRTASGTVFFDDQDRQVNFRARRYDTDTASVEIWETPISAHGQFDGVSVPIGGRGVWKLESGEFAYIEVEITSISYQ